MKDDSMKNLNTDLPPFKLDLLTYYFATFLPPSIDCN